MDSEFLLKIDFDKKVFWMWFLWLSASLAIIFLTFRLAIFSSLWGSLVGLLVWSFLLAPPVSVIAEKILIRIGQRNKRTVFIFVCSIILVFGAIYLANSLYKHSHFFTGYDLAIFDQAIWHFSNFELGDNSIRNVLSIFGDHFDPILIFLTPFYWIFSSPQTLLFLQVVILLLPALLLYFWGKKLKIKDSLLAIIILFYVSSPAIQAIINFDFHEIVFAPIFLVAAFYFLSQRKFLRYFLFVLLLLFTKEDLGLLVAAMGVFIALNKSHKDYKIGLATFVVGAAAFVLTLKLIMPHLNYHSYAYFDMYPGFENGLFNGIVNYARHPVDLAKTLLFFPSTDKWWSIAFFIAPLLIPIVLIPSTIFLFLPIIAERILSSYSPLGYMQFQYNILFAPIACLVFFYLIKNWPRFKYLNLLEKKTAEWRLSLLTIIIIFPLIVNLIFSLQNTYLFSLFKGWKEVASIQNKTELEELVKVIPDDVPVSASQIFLPHLSHRQNLYIIPRISNAQFVIFHLCHSRICNVWPITAPQTVELYTFLRSQPTFRVLKQNESGVVFERTALFDYKLEKKLAEKCASFIEESELYPLHKKYMLDNCQQN